jgi:CDP-6-deoxy-D-xylo-4-hexulose-3-dehydrase
LRDDAALSRREIISELEEREVGTRLLFGGNLTKQPAFKNAEWRVEGSLDVTDKVMRDSFWIGVWPGINEEMLDYMVDQLAIVSGRE